MTNSKTPDLISIGDTFTETEGLDSFAETMYCDLY